MKTSERLMYGLLMTASFFLIATFGSEQFPLNHAFIPDFFLTLIIEFLLSLIAIVALRKYVLYRISIPKFKTIFKPILFALLMTIAINVLLNMIITLAGGKIEMPEVLAKLNPLQVFLFVFISASIAEEMLFRGFLMNFLKPLETYGLSFFKRRLSAPVILSAIAFGMAHLVLLSTEVSVLFVIRIVIFTTCLGLIAGYYHEKYNNHAYAILVHMSGNLLAVLGAFAMHA